MQAEDSFQRGKLTYLHTGSGKPVFPGTPCTGLSNLENLPTGLLSTLETIAIEKYPCPWRFETTTSLRILQFLEFTHTHTISKNVT